MPGSQSEFSSQDLPVILLTKVFQVETSTHKKSAEFSLESSAQGIQYHRKGEVSVPGSRCMATEGDATPAWKLAIEQKRSYLDEILREWGISDSEQPSLKAQHQPNALETISRYLTAREIEITEKSACFILGKLKLGEWKAWEVMRAFCHRAALAHQLVNNLSFPPCDTLLDLDPKRC